MTRRVVATIAIGALALAGAACSGSKHATPTCASEIRGAAPVTDRGSRVANGTVLTVDAANAAFTPTCFTAVPRGTVTLRVRNTGLSLHDVQVTAQHIDVDVAPGHSVVVPVHVGGDPVVYVCKYHRGLGMVGVLIPAT